MPSTPMIGEMVHYVAYGTPGGEYGNVCRSAFITEVWSGAVEAGTVGLAVLNPTGLFFRSLNEGGNRFDPGYPLVGDDDPNHQPGKRFPGGTWHWPHGAGLR